MKNYVLHHKSLFNGYVAKSNYPDGIKEPYCGRFGSGYTIKLHNPDSRNYAIIQYWIEARE